MSVRRARLGFPNALIDGVVDPAEEHFVVRWAAEPSPFAEAPAVARLGLGPASVVVESLDGAEALGAEARTEVLREVRAMLPESGERDPWRYLRHHAGATGNLASHVRFEWHPGTGAPDEAALARALDALADHPKHAARVATDSPFQRRARLLQSLWRESHGHPMGAQGERPLGSRLEPEFAERTLANFLTPTIRDVVDDVLEHRTAEQLIRRDRLLENLLSSQPLCFNLFGELARDPDLATRAFARLFPSKALRILRIDFEQSPARHHPESTGDRSAFDVFVEYERAGRRGFIGIEVKYHEDLAGERATTRDAHEAVARWMHEFPDPLPAELREAPLQQIWRDHLLVGGLLRTGAYAEGFFLILYPERNAACAKAVSDYESLLVDGATFASAHLEEVAIAIHEAGAGTWIEELWSRYLDFAGLDRRIDALARHA